MELETTRAEFTNEAINSQWKQTNDELEETRLQLKTKDEENSQFRRENPQRYHLQDGLSSYSVLSALSGSLSPDALIFLVIFLLIQTSAAAFQEDEVTSFDQPSSVSSTPPTPKADSSGYLCLSHVNFYIILAAAAAAAVVVVLLLLFALLFAVRKRNHTGKATASTSREDLIPPSPEDKTQEKATASTSTEDLIPPSPEDKTQGFHFAEKEKQDTVPTLIEQQTETANLRNELLSQLEEVCREKEENKEKLRSVDKELETSTGHKKQKKKLSREKENLLESKWKLDEMKTEKEKVLLQTEKLLQTMDTVTNKMTGHKPG